VKDGSDNQAQEADVVIARIVKARGLLGEVACDIETDFPERFASLERVVVWMPDQSRIELSVEDHWFHKGRVIFKFEGYDSMTEAERLVGGRLVISQADAWQLEEGRYYVYEIVGSEVVTTAGKNVGRVERLMRTGGTDVLVVEGEGGREHLIPFADEICVDVDTEAGRITIEPPEGLLEL
jgi:16S rRNA processing protein RimM